MAYIFPVNPPVGTEVTGTNGAAWTWDGTKWVGGAGGPYVGIDGAMMTGPLYLAEDPYLPMEAATRQYVDHVADLWVEEANFDGQVYGRELGEWTPVVPITGALMRGSININGWPLVGLPAPTDLTDATNKQYVDQTMSQLQSYVGTWQPGPNNPNLAITSGLINGQYYIAQTANPLTPEAAPGVVPGIGGQLVYNGSMILWNAAGAIWQQVRSGQLTKTMADGLYLAIAGGTMTGPLLLTGSPTQPAEAATKDYVDIKVGTLAAGLSVGTTDTPPTPRPGMLWWDSLDTQLYIYYDDGTSAQWVAASNSGVAEAPSDGTSYGRFNNTWAPVIPVTQRGVANGVATLDSGAKVPVAQLPDSVRQSAIAFRFIGKPASNAHNSVVIAVPVTVPASLAGTVIYVGTQAVVNTTFILNKVSGGVTTTALGTITITPTSHVSCTLAGAGGALVAGDVLQLVAPTTPDSALSDIEVTVLVNQT